MKLIDYQSIKSIQSLRSKISLTGGQIKDEVRRKVNILHSLGIRENDKVMICHGGEPNFFTDLFAVWEIGCCAVCINPKTTLYEVQNIHQFIEPKALLVDDLLSFKELPYNCHNLSNHYNVSLEDSTNTCHDNMSDDALMLFTSGTTGTPKGVVHTFDSIINRLKLNLSVIPNNEIINTLCLLPMHFGHGLIGNCLTPLASESNLFLFNNMDLREASSLGDIINDNKINFFSSVPSMWKIILRLAKSPNLGNLKRIHVGSAPLSMKLWKEIIDWSGINNIVNMYGITETANWIAGASADKYEVADGLVGKMWGGEAYIQDDNGNISPQGHGTILIKTPSLMNRYYNLPEITDETIKDGFYDTGDIGLIDKDQVIRITGRKKFEINRAGIKINPEEIDLLLEQHHKIEESCAFAISDEIYGEVVGVAIKLRSDIEIAELKQWCSERILVDKIPSKWYVVPEILKNDRGKVDRIKVAQMIMDNKND